MFVSCKDVAVDPSTGKVIPREVPLLPNGNESGDSCKDCPSSRMRTSHDLREGSLFFDIVNINTQPSTPEHDTTELVVKIVPSTARSAGPNGALEDILSFEMSAAIPEITSKMNTNWTGYDIKTVRVNVPEMKLKEFAKAELTGDPEVKAGAMISFRPTGSGASLKYLKTGDKDKDEGKVSAGTVQITSIDRLRRVLVCRVQVMFFYRPDVGASPLRAFDVSLDLRFGY